MSDTQTTWGGGGTKIFSYIRRPGPFLGGSKFRIYLFIYFFGGGGSEK